LEVIRILGLKNECTLQNLNFDEFTFNHSEARSSKSGDEDSSENQIQESSPTRFF
jgi:hypothetical protein